MALDLNTLDTTKKAEEGTRLYFKHPDGSGAELTIFMDVLGRDSSVWINHQHENLLKRANKKVVKQAVDETDIAKVESEQIEFLAKMVIGMGDHEDLKKPDPKNPDKKGKEIDSILCNGEQLTFNKKNVIMLLDKFPWMREQVAAFIGDRANFL